MRKLALTIAAVALALTACSGDGDDPEAQATVTATATVTGTPGAFEAADEPTDDAEPFAPNVGDRALAAGEKRVGTGTVTTLQEVRLPYPPADYREPNPGNVFLGIRVKECLKADSTLTDAYTTFSADWSAVAVNGNEYGGGGGNHWIDWPTPKFPEGVTMTAGRCVKGWLAFEIPEKVKVNRIVWRPGGQTVAEWVA